MELAPGADAPGKRLITAAVNADPGGAGTIVVGFSRVANHRH